MLAFCLRAMHWSLLTQPLPGGVARLWFSDLAPLRSPELAAEYQRLLAPSESARQARFHFEKDRDLFLLAHALVRLSLSQVWPLPPEQWEFTAGEHGRPEVVLPPGAPALRFNLSHTGGLVMCGLTLGHDLGVDTEEIEPSRGTVEIANRFFSAVESRSLQRLEGKAKVDRFFDFWTLKEAYIKAKGAGLSLPLDRFAFDFEGARLRATFEAPLTDRPETWQFQLFAPTDHHRAAVAVDHGPGAPLRVEAHWTVPGLTQSPLLSGPIASSMGGG